MVGRGTIATEQHFYCCLFKLLLAKKYVIKRLIILDLETQHSLGYIT